MTSDGLLSVRNRSTYFLADIGDGSCVRSYAVTVGATALATTVNYATPVSTDCSFSVSSQVFMEPFHSSVVDTLTLWHFRLGTPLDRPNHKEHGQVYTGIQTMRQVLPYLCHLQPTLVGFETCC